MGLAGGSHTVTWATRAMAQIASIWLVLFFGGAMLSPAMGVCINAVASSSCLLHSWMHTATRAHVVLYEFR